MATPRFSITEIVNSDQLLTGPDAINTALGQIDSKMAGYVEGVLSARPTSTPEVPGIAGRLFRATDTGQVFIDTGTGWDEIAFADDTRFPTPDQKLALLGTSGSPSVTNRFVTDGDSRMTQRIARGVINADGSIAQAGSNDWTVSHTATGIYAVMIAPELDSTCAVAITPIGIQRFYALTSGPTTKGFQVTFSSSIAGAGVDQAFTFTATG